MAEFMTPAEIDAQSKQLYDQYDRGYISAKQLADGLNDARKGVRGYTQELSASLNQLGTSVKSTFDDIKNGKQGSSVFNNALNSGADSVAKAAMQFGPLGAAFGAVLKVLTFFVTAANDQSDALFKANQDLAKVGASGAGGMTEVYANLKQFGYGVGELADMSQLITQNSVALSNFSGTVAQGTRTLAGVAAGIQGSNLQEQFMNMGYSVDGMNKGIGAYISQQSYFSTGQKKTTEELRIGAADYLKNMATLSKLTGQNAEDMARQRNEALAIDSFNATLEGLDEQDRERQLERYNALSKIDKDMAIGYANQVSGFVGLGKQSEQLMMTTSGVSNRLAKDSKKPLGEFMQGMADATNSTHAIRKSNALLGGSDTYLSYNKTQKLAMQHGNQYIKAMQSAQAQSEAQAVGDDKLTAAAVRTRQAQMSTRDAFENLLQKGVLPLTQAVEGIADFVDNLTSGFGLFGTSQRQQTKTERAGLQSAEGAKGTGVARDTAARAADISTKLQARGFTQVEAAAIAGNLYAESSFDTGAINLASGAAGLMQWLGPRKIALEEFARSQGKKWTDESVQLDFIRKELATDNGYETQQFKKAVEAGGGDPAKTSYYFGKYVERPSAAELAGSAAKRANMAVVAYSTRPIADAVTPTKPTTTTAAAPVSRPKTDIATAQTGVPQVPGPRANSAASTSNQKNTTATVDPKVLVPVIQDLTSAQRARNSADTQIAMNK